MMAGLLSLAKFKDIATGDVFEVPVIITSVTGKPDIGEANPGFEVLTECIWTHVKLAETAFNALPERRAMGPHDVAEQQVIAEKMVKSAKSRKSVESVLSGLNNLQVSAYCLGRSYACLGDAYMMTFRQHWPSEVVPDDVDKLIIKKVTRAAYWTSICTYLSTMQIEDVAEMVAVERKERGFGGAQKRHARRREEIERAIRDASLIPHIKSAIEKQMTRENIAGLMETHIDKHRSKYVALFEELEKLVKNRDKAPNLKRMIRDLLPKNTLRLLS